jgi:hypothetical protein
VIAKVKKTTASTSANETVSKKPITNKQENQKQK